MLDVLRLELEKERAPVSVTAIMPPSIDTPFFDHSRSRTGMAPRPIPPIYDPQRVASAIVRAAVHPRRTVIVGGAGQLMVRLHRHFPRLVDAMLARSAFPRGARLSAIPVWQAGCQRRRVERPASAARAAASSEARVARGPRRWRRLPSSPAGITPCSRCNRWRFRSRSSARRVGAT